MVRRSGDIVKPKLGDLGGSGATERGAAVVRFLHGDDYYDPNHERRNLADVFVRKNQNGATGDIVLKYEEAADAVFQHRDRIKKQGVVVMTRITVTCLVLFLVVAAAHAREPMIESPVGDIGTVEDVQDDLDVVYLKNGTIIRGKIIEQTSETLTIQASDGNVCIYPIDAILKTSKTPYRHKNPYTSCCMSLVFPGAGQVYNEEPGKGIMFLGGFFVGAIIMYSGAGPQHDAEAASDRVVVGSLMVVGSYLASAIDASISSVKINRKRGDGDSRRKVTLEINPITSPTKRGAMISFRF